MKFDILFESLMNQTELSSSKDEQLKKSINKYLIYEKFPKIVVDKVINDVFNFVKKDMGNYSNNDETTYEIEYKTNGTVLVAKVNKDNGVYIVDDFKKYDGTGGWNLMKREYKSIDDIKSDVEKMGAKLIEQGGSTRFEDYISGYDDEDAKQKVNFAILNSLFGKSKYTSADWSTKAWLAKGNNIWILDNEDGEFSIVKKNIHEDEESKDIFTGKLADCLNNKLVL